jgi:hypothetical protein
MWVIIVAIIWASASVAQQERFKDNGDGTVTDRLLGVMWAQSDNQGDVTWRDAQYYCRMGPPQILGKYDNWRMPTLEELRSLYTGRRRDAAGYETPCGQHINIYPQISLSCGWVWSSEAAGITAYVFNFQRGYHFSVRKVQKRHYRALPVRDLEPPR